MIAFTHITFAILLTVLTFKENTLLLSFAIIGALLPDIDHPFSFAGRLFPNISYWINEEFGHRTITHSLLFLLPFGIVSLTLNPYLLALALGLLSHYLLDLHTNQGIQLLYPYNANFTIFNGKINTGSKKDYILGILFLTGFLFIICYHKFWIQA